MRFVLALLLFISPLCFATTKSVWSRLEGYSAIETISSVGRPDRTLYAQVFSGSDGYGFVFEELFYTSDIFTNCSAYTDKNPKKSTILINGVKYPAFGSCLSLKNDGRDVTLWAYNNAPEFNQKLYAIYSSNDRLSVTTPYFDTTIPITGFVEALNTLSQQSPSVSSPQQASGVTKLTCRIYLGDGTFRDAIYAVDFSRNMVGKFPARITEENIIFDADNIHQIINRITGSITVSFSNGVAFNGQCSKLAEQKF